MDSPQKLHTQTPSPDTSNPFIYLYTSSDQSVSPPHQIPELSKNDKLIHDQAYLDIENQIKSNGTSPRNSKHIVTDLPPIVTVVESVKRSGSIVSNSASLRNRNKLKSRTKMMKRSDAVSVGVASGVHTTHIHHNIAQRDPIHYNIRQHEYLDAFSNVDDSRAYNESKVKYRTKNFQFSVKRKTSLKRKSAPNGYSNLSSGPPKFKDQTDLNEFLDYCYKNPKTKISELLPRAVQFFEFRQLISRKPHLVGAFKDIKDTELATMLISPEPKPVPVKIPIRDIKISSPIKESFTKNDFNPYTASKDYNAEQTGTTSSGLGLAAGGVALGSTPRGKSSSKSILTGSPGAKNRMSSVPPHQYNTLQPQVTTPYSHYRDTLYASKSLEPVAYSKFFPGSTMSRKTIAQMNRTVYLEVLMRRTLAAKISYRLRNNNGKRLSTSELEESSSTSGDTDFDPNPNSHGGLPKLSRGSDDSESDDESIHTADLIRRTSLLSSDLLPSPQISYSTGIFGNIGEFEFPEFDSPSQKSVVSVELIKKWSPQQTMPVSSDRVYVNDFNKTYFAQYGTTNVPNSGVVNVDTFDSIVSEKNDSPESNILHNNMYELKPLNRSSETVTSSEPESMGTPTPVDRSSKGRSSRTNSTSENTTSFPRALNKRHSSISSSIVLRSQLDDIASQITTFMNEEIRLRAQESPVIFPVVGESSPSPHVVFSDNKSEKVEYLMKNATRVKHSTHSMIDIKSMQGSLRVAGPLSEESRSVREEESVSFTNFSINPQRKTRTSPPNRLNHSLKSIADSSVYSSSSKYDSSS
ncbi:hypothetical protein CAAN1_03S02080 [[Candida] anglica]|uniref:Uncharacterized protein n=1 Tax=[Candida] anglica TaxID=148631 RepID=A0ABP0EL19_9ASCO